jgi:Short C-terminal domain
MPSMHARPFGQVLRDPDVDGGMRRWLRRPPHGVEVVQRGRRGGGTGQSWAPGSYGCGAFLLALLLAFVLIGVFIFLYMLFVKPDGTLSVIYVRRDPIPARRVSPQPSGGGDPAVRLAQLSALLKAGAITEDEYAAKRAEILAKL